MSDLLRVGFKDSEGNAQAGKVDGDFNIGVTLGTLNERILINNKNIKSGDEERVTVNTNKPYVIFVVKHDNPSGKWRVANRQGVDGNLESVSALKTRIKSDGERIVIGYGARTTASSNLITPVGKGNQFRLYNESQEDGNFSLYIVEYPFGVGIDGREDTEERMFEIREVKEVQQNSEVILFESTGKTTFEHLEFFTTGEKSRLRISYLDENGETTILGLLSVDRLNYGGFRPLDLVESSMFTVNVFEPNKYKFTLNKHFNFLYGVKVEFLNEDTESQTMGCRAYGVVKG